MGGSTIIAPSAEAETASAQPLIRLLTPEAFRTWEQKYEAPLAQAAGQRDTALDSDERSRFCLAQDAVLRALQLLRKRGLVLGEAGAELQHTWGRHCAYSYDDLLAVLRALGWKPCAKRRKPSLWSAVRG